MMRIKPPSSTITFRLIWAAMLGALALLPGCAFGPLTATPQPIGGRDSGFYARDAGYTAVHEGSHRQYIRYTRE